MLYKKIFRSILSIVAIFVFSITIAYAQEVETYEVDNMEFTVGKHKPKERVNPKKEKEQVITQTIVINGDDKSLEPLKSLEEDVLDLDDDKKNKGKEKKQEKKEKQKNVEIQKKESKKDSDTSKKEEISMGSWVDGAWGVLKRVVFSASVVFENVVSYLDKVTFMDRVTFADKDMGGKAIIRKGSREVKVVYEKQFITKPIVSATVEDTAHNFAIQDETEKGFSLVIEKPIDKDLVFSWIAIKVADFKTFKSKEIPKGNKDNKKDDKVDKIKQEVDKKNNSEKEISNNKKDKEENKDESVEEKQNDEIKKEKNKELNKE